MSGNKRFFLDTNYIIGILKGDINPQENINNAEWIGVSVISSLEFLSFSGITENDINCFNAFINKVNIVNIHSEDNKLINTILDIRKKHKIKLPDSIILASAQINNAKLLTNDHRLKIK